MRAVVTGGLGFLGAAIVRRLVRVGAEVTVFDHRASADACTQRFGDAAVRAVAGDICDRRALTDAFAGADAVYHLAGKLGTSELNTALEDAVSVNVLGALRVFEVAEACGVRTVFHPTKPQVWLNAYTVTKVAAEGIAEIFRSSGRVRVVSLRYFNAYGPEQALGPVRKIIPTFAVAALRRQPIPVFGDGQQTVDMIHADDVARFTVDLVGSGYDGPPLDCGRGIALTVNEVADAVNAVVGSSAGIRHLPMRDGETPGTQLVADTRGLASAVGPLRFEDWRTSLEACVRWYADHVAGTAARDRVA